MKSSNLPLPSEQVRVMVTRTIGDECLRMVSDVSSRIELIDAADILVDEQRGDPSASKKLDDLLAMTEVIYGVYLPRNVISRAGRLRWVQIISAGVEHIMSPEMIQSPVVVTNIRGMSATPIAEFVISAALMLVKRAPLCFQLQQSKQWQVFTVAGLHSKTIGIVGLGSIGREVARLARAFGMRVIATRRTVSESRKTRNVDIMLPNNQLLELLSESDFVALTLPLTPETDKLIGEKELRAMKPNAYLINISRGNVVDEEALIRALEEQWIAGAGLDVFATEPLPGDSKLWGLPNVILSPHIAGSTENEIEMATALFAENLRRYLNGDRLFNVVDKKKGY
ncbi:MAG: D-2-hydroxyacid dehydrogenase [Dehalococcoidales bacterium]|nr:MAG: D-2-hydroxyacid dehydrogenase [Dehalococcoidales bacterium]